MEQAPVNVVAQVKSNGYSVSAIRDFRTAMRDKNADIGVFIALDGGNPTPRMREQQEAEGNDRAQRQTVLPLAVLVGR